MRLIDGDALKEKLQEQQKYGSTADSRGRAKAIVEVIHAPTIEAEPVKHGRWITHDRYQYKCSECETIFRSESQHIKRRGEFLWDIEEPRFCPRCGAKMDGDKT